MTDDHIFMMGNFAARIPTDRLYSDNHLWLQQDGDSYRVGFTAYSVRLLRDVYFLDWNIERETLVSKKQEIGEIESSKALSSLYAPTGGTVVAFNEGLLDDPSAINTDNYGDGWLFAFTTTAALLSPDDYIQVLEAGWDDTQRHLKGQLN